jgi:hypothetical protein
MLVIVIRNAYYRDGREVELSEPSLGVEMMKIILRHIVILIIMIFFAAFDLEFS